MEKDLLLLYVIAFFGLNAHTQTILGVDVSHFDSDPPLGPENWQQVKAAGKVFAWAKATQGIDFTDSTFVRNETDGTSADVIMGAYHFATPEDNGAAAEANYFLSVAGPYIKPGYLPPVLDLEDPPDGPVLSDDFSKAALTTWVQTWMSTVQNATGIAPILYTDGSYAAYLESSLNTYGLWVADPDNSATTPPTADLGVWTTWAFKQYSWTGTVSGINNTSGVDLDVFNGNMSAFNNLIGTSAVTPVFTASARSVCTGNTITYTDQSSSTGTITGYNWSFQGGTPDTSTAKDPTVTYNTAGTYNVKELVTSTTGKDSVTLTGYLHVIPSSSLPLLETFQSATFPPPGWTMNFPVPGDSAWELCTETGYNSTQCMYFPANCGYTNSIAGERQQIYTPEYSFSGVSNAEMWFDVAYEPYNSTYSDTLAIYYSLNCGNTWTLIYLKGGATLCTTGSTDAAGTDTSGGNGCFVPPNSQAWRTDSINLALLNGDVGVMFSFESRSGWGNIIYIDNINISSGTAVSCTPPAAPLAVSPGTASATGSSVSSISLQWDSSSGDLSYYPRISQCPYGSANILWSDSCIAGNSLVASGLATGNLYRWNMSAYSDCGNSNCESGSSNTLYFSIPPVLTAGGVTSFCSGDSVLLSTSAGNTVSTPEFIWYLNGRLIDSSATGGYYARESGNYTVVVEYSCGATGTSNAIALSVSGSVTPAITITQVTSGPVCDSSGVLFNSIITNGGSNPVYLWAASNGQSGTGSSFTLACAANGVTVACKIISNLNCAVPDSAISNTLTLSTQPPLPVTLSIFSSDSSVCAGTGVSLRALSSNAGNSPVYAWQINGITSGGDSTFLSVPDMQNSDTVLCILTSSASCVVDPVTRSNQIIIEVNPEPVANAGSYKDIYPTTVSRATLGGNPVASGGTAPYSYLWSPSTGLNSSTIANPVVSGISSSTAYILSVTDAKGCAGTDTVLVHILNCNVPTPVVELNLCDLDAQFLPSVSYQWFLQNDSVAGADTRFLSASQPGYYYVVLTDSNGCRAQSGDTYVNYPGCLTSGINEIADIPDFKIYPNPVTSQLVVEFESPMLTGTHVELYDVFGQCIMKPESLNPGHSGSEIDIDMKSLASGIYFVQIIYGEKRLTMQRILKL